MPTSTKENYLKAMLAIANSANEVSLTELAKKMEVSKPTTNEMVKKMELKGWVKYEKYKPLILTKKGRTEAALIVRKHRLAEMFLDKIMGFGWEEVHEIAEEIEHIQTDKFFDRMDELLGFPTIDPHGSPIPNKVGEIRKLGYVNLTKLKKGEKGTLRGLTKSSKELLEYLNKKGIELESSIIVTEIESFDKSVEICLNDHDSATLSHEVCQHLLIDYS